MESQNAEARPVATAPATTVVGAGADCRATAGTDPDAGQRQCGGSDQQYDDYDDYENDDGGQLAAAALQAEIEVLQQYITAGTVEFNRRVMSGLSREQDLAMHSTSQLDLLDAIRIAELDLHLALRTRSGKRTRRGKGKTKSKNQEERVRNWKKQHADPNSKRSQAKREREQREREELAFRPTT
eukprot:SAG22_NODE_2461_length_2544_cov_2.351329_3_plen_184_part_00